MEPILWVNIHQSFIPFHGFDAMTMDSHQVNGSTIQNNAITSPIPTPFPRAPILFKVIQIPPFIPTVILETSRLGVLHVKYARIKPVPSHVMFEINQSGLTPRLTVLNFPIYQCMAIENFSLVLGLGDSDSVGQGGRASTTLLT